MKQILITGGSGFFGGVCKRQLLDRGYHITNIDLQPDHDAHENLRSVQGDIRDAKLMEQICSERPFDAIFHFAAILAHVGGSREFLWSCNTDGTRQVAETARKHGIANLVFTSSNCLWGEGFGRPIHEDDEPHPVEIYGRSKLEAENILKEYENDMNITTIRCPTIMDAGRLGLLSILFEFIDEGRKVWVIGGGKNRYQFIYAGDLIDACIRGAEQTTSNLFHIGSDHVQSFRDVYQSVIDRAGTGARVASLPAFPTLQLMKLAHILHLSPLGPYQYKMIAENFEFDTSHIKDVLQWKPTVNNEQMLWKAYEYYQENKKEIYGRKDVSAHKQPAKMGIIRLLKWLS